MHSKQVHYCLWRNIHTFIGADRFLSNYNQILSWRASYFQFPAQEQAELQKKYDALKAEVDKRDADIKQLQRSLKEAENILVCILTVWMFEVAYYS